MEEKHGRGRERQRYLAAREAADRDDHLVLLPRLDGYDGIVEVGGSALWRALDVKSRDE